MALEKAFTNNLTLDLYLIGYNKEGESVVLIIKVDGVNYYSIVIDSYKANNNETIELLKENGVDYINLLCWTHPHRDHSVDLKSILEKCNNSTKYVLADGLEQCVESFTNDIKEIYLDIDNIIKSNKKKFIDVLRASGTKNNIIDRFFVTRLRTKKKYPFTIDILAPVPKIIEKKRVFDKVGDDINLYSIALLIKLGKFNIFLGGDVEDDYYFKVVPKEHIPDKIDYIKIPHHGSKYSQGIFEWLNRNRKCMVACTTTKGKKTPNKETLFEYLKYSKKLWCTKDIFDDNNNLGADHGIIHTHFDIAKRIITTKKKSGNSVEITTADIKRTSTT